MAERRDAVGRLKLDIDKDLPIAAARDEIAAALQAHQVVIISGETGSGKTTQLPKICLQSGFGVNGMIGHTQPRRIAARSVARRVAAELDTTSGDYVGVKLRFRDETGPKTLLKLMTDGILLNEIRSDRDLRAYDALIIDEAHERSLNIDFILGYLKQLLRRRSDLRVIITSATIQPEHFSAHFDSAPVIFVRGRSYPVEVLYSPRRQRQPLADAVVAAANELFRDAEHGPDTNGDDAVLPDTLVFLPGERWIRETGDLLRRHGPKGIDILPLYARLSETQQDSIFDPGPRPRIVLATNVAETSLTVPRIRFVIDSGLARVSRYAARHRFQGLRVEPVSQASAQQRAGRCGRTSAGRCIRLYSEADFTGRPEFTEPEILRTNLAGVILQLKALGLGEIDKFPFPDQPPAAMVNDALRLLSLLGALDARQRLTKIGRLMARMPVEPRVARLLCGANLSGALREGLVIASALSVADPRETGADGKTQGSEEVSSFLDSDSDFASYLEIWRQLRLERKRGSQSVRKWCRKHRLSYSRVLEWEDVHAQLDELTREFGWRRRSSEASYRQVHEAVLSAFVDFLGERIEKGRYRGINDVAASIFPGSGLAGRSPKWIVAAERVAMEQQYFRTAARINPGWLRSVCPHLITKIYLEPAWNATRARVEVVEVSKILGLEIGRRRGVDYGVIAPETARAVFIREGLAKDALRGPPKVLLENREAAATVLGWEARLRRRDFYIGEPGLARFYAARLPDDVRDAASLKRFCEDEARAATLRLSATDLTTRVPSREELDGHPTHLELAGQRLALEYVYDPISEFDGVSLSLPEGMLEAVGPEIVDWIIPGWLPEKLAELLRQLPKELRRRLVPIPDSVAEILPQVVIYRGRERLAMALRRALLETHGIDIDEGVFDEKKLSKHLNMRVQIGGAGRNPVPPDRDFARQRIGVLNETSNAAELHLPGASQWTKTNLAYTDFIDLPDQVTLSNGSKHWTLYPALGYANGRVNLGLRAPSTRARVRHGEAVLQLVLKSLQQQVGLVRKRLARDQQLALLYYGVGSAHDLADDITLAAAQDAFPDAADVRTRSALEALRDAGRQNFVDAAMSLTEQLRETLLVHRDVWPLFERRPSRVPEAARRDMREQLGRLVHSRTMSSVPREWRGELKRYVEGITIRWDKLEHGHPKDAYYQHEIERAWARLIEWQAARPRGWPLSPEAERYRWLVEEYRISLFAQTLGTREPISAKRLEAAWRSAESSTRAALEYT